VQKSAFSICNFIVMGCPIRTDIALQPRKMPRLCKGMTKASAVLGELDFLIALCDALQCNGFEDDDRVHVVNRDNLRLA